jgi:hypothetical protein
MKTAVKMILLSLVVVQAFVLLPSCKKEKNKIHVEGIIMDPNTGIVLENALVVFSAKKITDGVYNAGFEEIARMNTEANGAYRFEMDEDYVSAYRISVSKQGYFASYHEISGSDITSDEVFVGNYNLYPIGYIRLEVRNFAPFDTADYITYTFSSGYVNGFDCCDNSIRHGAGENYADTIVCKTYGNQNVTVSWNVTKNQMTTQHSQTIYCAAFDTTYFQLNY